MRVNKGEMARRIQLCLSSISFKNMDSEEQVDRILHYFARLHGVGVASEETEKDIRYVFVRYQHGNIRETDGDNYATFDVYADISLSRIWYERYVSKTAVEEMLYYIERDLLKITSHWEEYLKEADTSNGFRANALIVDDLVPKKHDDQMDAMCYLAARGSGKTGMVLKKMIELGKAKTQVDVASMYPTLSPASLEYIENDVKATRELYKQLLINRNSFYGRTLFNNGLLDISDVIFNDPATIVLWRDGSKTVVKAQDGETYDPEKGLAMAICKKTMGNTRDYYNVFLKHLKKWKKDEKSVPEKTGSSAVQSTGSKHMYPTFQLLSDFGLQHNLTVNYNADTGEFIFINHEGVKISFEADQLETVDRIDKIVNSVRSFFGITE